jgi:hypothetical protein
MRVSNYHRWYKGQVLTTANLGKGIPNGLFQSQRRALQSHGHIMKHEGAGRCGDKIARVVRLLDVPSLQFNGIHGSSHLP